MFFSSTKSENRRAEHVLPRGGWWRVNAKIIPVETVPGIGGVGMKESRGGDEFKYDIFDKL
jgi:hypothetical protein